jgi:hypothetical protein
VAFAGCDASESTAVAASEDAAASDDAESVGNDTPGSLDIVAPSDAIVPDEDTGPPTPKLVADPTVLAPMLIESWMVHTYTSSAQHALLRNAIASGAVEMPTESVACGMPWTAVTPSENGEIPVPALGQAYYLIASFELTEPTGVVVRSDGPFTVIIGHQRQPGDVYQSGKHRAPFYLPAGQHTILANGSRRNKPPLVPVWTTPDELERARERIRTTITRVF